MNDPTPLYDSEDKHRGDQLPRTGGVSEPVKPEISFEWFHSNNSRSWVTDFVRCIEHTKEVQFRVCDGYLNGEVDMIKEGDYGPWERIEKQYPNMADVVRRSLERWKAKNEPENPDIFCPVKGGNLEYRVTENDGSTCLVSRYWTSEEIQRGAWNATKEGLVPLNGGWRRATKPEPPIAKYEKAVMKEFGESFYTREEAARFKELSASVISEGRKCLQGKREWIKCDTCKEPMAFAGVKVRSEGTHIDHAILKCKGCDSVTFASIQLPEAIRRVCAPGSRFDAMRDGDAKLVD